VEIERQGIPAATIVGAEWASLAESTAREHGYDGLPLIVVPRSFERLTRDRVIALAGEIANDVIHALATPAETLREEFSDRWETSAGVTVSCSVRIPLGVR
jgi:hypothetical protein